MCRRCSDCPNNSHHWIYSPDADDDMNSPDHECKHCNALGVTCGECLGDGFDPSDERDAPGPCPDCDGEGVILVAGGDVVYTRSMK